MPKIIEQEQSIHLLAQTEKRKEAILGCMGSFFPITGSSRHARQFPKYSKSETSVLPWTSGSVFWLVEIEVAKLKVHKVQIGYIALNWMYMSSPWLTRLRYLQSHSSFMCSAVIVSSLPIFLVSILCNKNKCFSYVVVVLISYF